MRHALTEEQTWLGDAVAQALARHDTLRSARVALDGEAPPSLWATAVGAGWPGLLSGEDADGAALGALEAMLVVEGCGRHLADARLLGHLPATALAERTGDRSLRADLASGRMRGALVDGMADGRRAPTVVARGADSGLRLRGRVEWVLDAPDADVLAVCAEGEDGAPVAALLDPGSPGVTVEPRDAYDATRSLAHVVLDGAPAERLAAGAAQVVTARHLQRALLGAESLGAASACLDRACDHARERVAFGRAIGSYQAIKHRLVEMLRRIENARSLVFYAGWAWWSRPEEFALAANALLVGAGDALDLASRESIFVHGGLGATWEHDCSLYYRRAELSRRLAGGADAAADAVAEELLSGAR
ncbi:MAG TPA: acyl-CoA dehydrogenase family protein [Candidatus Dormibacteraeota bacterium]|nr:acyl-CoA dehydrogenase family protein [Candidatus Dormibacteraeota bacterium]